MSPAIGFVFLGPKARLSRSTFSQHFIDTWDDVVSPPEIEKKDASLIFHHGEFLVAVAMMPAPFPPSDLEGPCETSWLWPTAAKDLAGHRGHLLVTVMAPDDVDPIEHRKVLTKVIASLLATTPDALGVYWGDATLVVPSEMFVEMATESLPGEAPLPLWCDFRVGPVDEDSGLSFGFTAGLESLGHKELITENASESPGELVERLMSIAGYLLANGPVIEDGHTVGEDAKERITVVVDKSPFGHEGEVMRLDYASKKKRRWFGR